MAKHTATVELFYSGVWNAAPLYSRDPIVITRDEQAEFITSRAGLTLDDRSCIYNPRNPLSPLFGLAGRNTPIRITVDSGLRFYGEIASWRPRRTVDFDPVTGRGDAWCEIEAAGIMRRLGQGTPPVRSPLRRSIPATDPVAYWPCEDGAAANWAASAFPGHSPLTVTGTVSFRPVSEYEVVSFVPGTSALVDLSDGGTLTATLPASVTAATAAAFSASVTVDLDPATMSGDLNLLEVSTPGGTFARWVLRLTTGLRTRVVAITAGGAETVVADALGVTSSFVTMDFSVWQDGANIAAGVQWFDSLGHFADDGTVAGTLTGATIIKVNSTGVTQTPALPCGHLSMWATHPAPTLDDPRISYEDETVSARLTRLCDEEAVAFTLVGTASEAMGPQPAATFADLLREIQRTEDGILFERRDAAALKYRARGSLYNQTPALALNFAVPNQVAAPLEPAVDDVGIRNDITVKRTGGSSARAVLDAGPMSVQPPPAGVGRVGTQVEVNTADDTRLADFAGWHLRKGTVDATRYERVTVDLDANPGLAAAASAVDIGDVITIANTEEGGATLLVRGYTETVGSHRRIITFNTTPYAPWLWLTDTFTHTVSNEWGTSTSGHVWTVSGAAASQFFVNGFAGVHTVNALHPTTYLSLLAGVSRLDFDLLLPAMLYPISPTGAHVRTELLVRYVDANNFVSVMVLIQPGNVVDLQVISVVGGVGSALAAAATVATHSAGTSLKARVRAAGSTLKARVWRDGTTEPATWQAEGTDPTPRAGDVGILTLFAPGNTNTLPVNVVYDDLAEVRF